MCRWTKSVALAIVMASFAVSAIAQEKPRASISDPPDYDPLQAPPYVCGGDHVPANRPQRIGIAVGLLNDLQDISSVISNLSPTQRRWLQTEYFDALKLSGYKYTQSILDVTNTPEYATFMVKDRYLYSLLPILRWLSSEAPAQYTAAFEVRYWTWVSKRLTSAVEFQNALQILVRKNSALTEILFSRKQYPVGFLAYNLALEACAIQERIIEPYINGLSYR